MNNQSLQKYIVHINMYVLYMWITDLSLYMYIVCLWL